MKGSFASLVLFRFSEVSEFRKKNDFSFFVSLMSFFMKMRGGQDATAVATKVVR